ncbi:Hypothetical predicted protein, partial [Paramuricea clavata]
MKVLFSEPSAQNESDDASVRNACHHKIFNFFCKNFTTVDEAEKHFNIKYFDDHFPLVVCSKSTPKSGQVCACPSSVNLSPIFEHSPTTEKVVVSDTNGHAIKSVIALVGQLSSMQEEQLLSRLLFQYIGEDLENNIIHQMMNFQLQLPMKQYIGEQARKCAKACFTKNKICIHVWDNVNCTTLSVNPCQMPCFGHFILLQ